MLSISFGEDKTKCIFFSKIKHSSELNISYGDHIIKFLTPRLKRLLCNALINSHFDCGYTLWFPLLNINLKNKLQTAQNKYIRLCLGLPPHSHIVAIHLLEINWLPERVESCIATTVFKCRDCTVAYQGYVCAFIQLV